MALKRELNDLYKEIYQKDFPSSTLSKWVKKKVIRAEKQPNGTYNYNIEDFKQKILSNEYQTMLKAERAKPKDFIGKRCGDLLIKKIVPTAEKKENYIGTLMYCDCLACGTKNIQVRFSYLTDNGNYTQDSCGCKRKRRSFLSSSREGITEEFVNQFSSDFEKFLCIHKLLTSSVCDGYYTKCQIEEYEQAIKYFYIDKQFNAIYDIWKDNKKKEDTFYDWLKPSIDHIIPKSKGGGHELSNLQILTVFENLNKRDMTWDEWVNFKQRTHTTSDYYIESILKRREG